MNEARWLLVLGSNAGDAARRLDASLSDVGVLGKVERCSARLEGEDIAGRGPNYLNQLLVLRSALDADALRAELKRIEQRHGRREERLVAGVCDLDIDLLARLDDGGPAWLTDKPLKIPAVRRQLHEWALS